MADYDEEQSSELETLRCIYTEQELTEVSTNPTSFQIKITVNEPTDSEELTVSVEVRFAYPPTYPDVAPETAVVSQEGLTDEHVKEVETLLQEQAAENLGMVMVFTLVSAVQEKLNEIVESIKSEKERAVREKEEELKRKEEAKFHGTPVTRENFLEWRKRFEEEMKLSSGKQSSSLLQPPRLTGRQMFERDASLAISDARFLTEAASVVETEEQETVEVDESLFQDLEDLTLEQT